MVTTVAVNITGLLFEREEQPGPQAASYPTPRITGAYGAEQVEQSVQAALHDYFQRQGIYADLKVTVVDPNVIEQRIEGETDSMPAPQDDGYYDDAEYNPL